MYGAVDPVYMLMLIKNLGPSYEVWDKAATIRFKKPGRSTLYAAFKLDQEEIDQIRNELSRTESIDRVYNIDLTDEKGATCATVEKVIHIRKKEDTDKARDSVSLDREPSLRENLLSALIVSLRTGIGPRSRASNSHTKLETHNVNRNDLSTNLSPDSAYGDCPR